MLVVVGAVQRGSEESMFAVRGRSCGLVFVLGSDGLLYGGRGQESSFAVVSEVDSSYSI